MPVLPAPSSPTHVLPGALFTALASPSRGSSTTSVWRVAIAPGTPATPHEVTCEEIFVVLSGRANVRLGEEQREAAAGDAIVVPPDTSFEISCAGDEASARSAPGARPGPRRRAGRRTSGSGPGR